MLRGLNFIALELRKPPIYPNVFLFLFFSFKVRLYTVLRLVVLSRSSKKTAMDSLKKSTLIVIAVVCSFPDLVSGWGGSGPCKYRHFSVISIESVRDEMCNVQDPVPQSPIKLTLDKWKFLIGISLPIKKGLQQNWPEALIDPVWRECA